MRGIATRVALVTGAARGIGLGIAERLLEEGCMVAMLDSDGDAVRSAESKLTAEHGTRVIALDVDVRDEQSVRASIERCAEEFGGLDFLINNAGVDGNIAPECMTREAWLRVQDVDLWGPMLLVREALPLLVRARGAVVNIASTHAFVTEPGRAAYAAAKAGVTGLTRALALDLGPRGVRVNAVLPGYIRTPIWNMWLDVAPDADALIAAIGARHPVSRVGTPADVAGLVAFLCSDDASFITGAAYLIDGGYTVQAYAPTA